MALPLSTTTAQTIYENFSSFGNTVKSICDQVKSAGASIPLNTLGSLLTQAQALSVFSSSIAADPTATANVIAYVQSQTGSTTVATDFATSHANIQALVAAVVSEYPVNQDGFMLDRKIDPASNQILWVSIPSTSIPKTLAAINAWVSTVA